MSYAALKTALIVVVVWSANPALGMPQAPALQEFKGRLEFSGEFTLFPFPASSARARECVSGAFPLRKHLRAKRLYRGKSVRLRGWLVPYSSLVDYVGATERGWRGTPIPNYCGGEYVILAKKVNLDGER